MSDRLYGSLDVTRIIELLSNNHSSLSKSEKNGHIYMNIVGWLSMEGDKNDNNLTIQPSTPKNATDADRAAAKKIYLANMRLAKPEPPSADDVAKAKLAFAAAGGTMPEGNGTTPPAAAQAQQQTQPALSGPVTQPTINAGATAIDDLPF